MAVKPLFSLIILLLALAGCSRERVELRFAAPLSPIDGEIVADLTALFDHESRIALKPSEETFSGEAALDAVLAGQADIALVSNALPYRDGISTVIPLFPTVLHIGYTSDRDFTDGADLLQGARVYAGAPGSASRMIFEQSTRRTGLRDGQFTYVDTPAQSDVAVIFAPISPDRLRDYPNVRLFSLGPTDSVGTGAAIDAATLLNPYLKPFVIPVGTYGDANPEPILTLAVDKMLVTRRDLDPNVVYYLISELLRLRPALASGNPGLFRNLSGDFDPSHSTFVLHSGAQAYLERSEPSVYERYSGIAEVAVTVLIALISALFGGMRLYKMKRKNRIDAYYSQVIAVRNRVNASLDSGARRSLVDELRALQDRAFKELVDEKLAADESFRIFITLSNDVLRQLDADSGGPSLTDA